MDLCRVLALRDERKRQEGWRKKQRWRRQEEGLKIVRFVFPCIACFSFFPLRFRQFSSKSDSQFSVMTMSRERSRTC